MKNTTFEVRLESLPKWHTTPVQRLRIALKVLLRAFGLRATQVREVDDPEPDPNCQCDMCRERRTEPAWPLPKQ